jgi:hypothetical protein
MAALEAEQSHSMRWGVASVEQFCGRAMIECAREVARATRPFWVTMSADTGMRAQEVDQGAQQGAGQGGYGRGSATETHRGRDRALRREWWAQSEAARRGEETGVPLLERTRQCVV